MDSGLSKLGILAGKGDLPAEIVTACKKAERPYLIVAFVENTPSALVDGQPHLWARLGKVGSLLDALRQEGVRELVMAGRIERPSLGSLRPDAKAARLLARLGASLFAGDDRLLRAITGFLEEEGFTVVGVDRLLVDALAPQGVIGRHVPSPAGRMDMEKAYKIAKMIGECDIGQAVMVCNGHVLGVEAMEGTDQLIARCASLRSESGGGVLVKAKKPGQERRADLPAIGPHTIRHLHDAGFAGLGIEAGETLIVSRRETIAAADEADLFLYGLNSEGR